MTTVGPFLLALLPAAVFGVTAYLLITTLARRNAETEAGLARLASLRWRDFAHLTLDALRREGFVEANVERQPGDSDFDFVLAQNGDRWLLSCKHGTRYRLGEQTVREFATAIRMQGAQGGIIATLGHSDGFASEIAKTHNVRLLDGRRLWPMLHGVIPPDQQREVALAAERKTQRLLALTALITVGLVALAFVFASRSLGPDIDANVAPDPARPASTAVSGQTEPAAHPADRDMVTSRAVNGPGSGSNGTDDSTLASHGQRPPASAGSPDLPLLPPELTEQEREHRRGLAAQRVSSLEGIASSVWSTRSTLVIALSPSQAPSSTDAQHADPQDAGQSERSQGDDLFALACAELVRFEELRYSRLQIEPPAGSTRPVRWRQCQ